MKETERDKTQEKILHNIIIITIKVLSLNNYEVLQGFSYQKV